MDILDILYIVIIVALYVICFKFKFKFKIESVYNQYEYQILYCLYWTVHIVIVQGFLLKLYTICDYEQLSNLL